VVHDFPAESCQCRHCEICCVWACIIMQYSDLSQFPRPLFANHLACSIMMKAPLIMHINCCTVWQSCVKMWEQCFRHLPRRKLCYSGAFGKKLKPRSTLNHPHESFICSKLYVKRHISIVHFNLLIKNM
jgi:hypothetical protein